MAEQLGESLESAGGGPYANNNGEFQGGWLRGSYGGNRLWLRAA
jgi:hypothetical protein